MKDKLILGDIDVFSSSVMSQIGVGILATLALASGVLLLAQVILG